MTRLRAGAARHQGARPRNLLLALVLLLLGVGQATGQVAPDARWRELETAHFRVSYEVGLDTLARRAAERAEEAFALLAQELPTVPRGKVELVIADNVDFANGYASIVPTNRVVIYAHPPIDTPNLAYYTDWLGLVVLHELVHIFQLDASEGIWRRLRRVFGRNLALFPQLYTPSWLKEGLAVYYESRLTPAGRIRGTHNEMVLRTAMLQDAFFSIDRITGDPATWPGGNTRYVYGSRFLQFLAERHGAERVPALVDRLSRQWVPYRPDAAARRSLGTSFSRAYGQWEDSLRTRYTAVADSLRALGLTEPEILTREGRQALFPRFSPTGDALAYSASTGRDEPAVRVLLPGGEPRTAVERSSLGPVAWAPDGRGLLFSQLEFSDPYRIHSDLFRGGMEGDRDRLTRGARLSEADLHPDGSRVIAVADADGTNTLALHDLRSGSTRTLIAPEVDVHWALPRWSPDGSLVAVSRWSAGGLYDVVLVDTAGVVRRELTRDRAVDTSPAWSPDGRYVVFSSDRTGVPNLFAYDLREGRLLQVTNVLTGAEQPDVSPDGRWIAFAYYQADGYHIARIPYDPSRWRAAAPPRAELGAPVAASELAEAVSAPSRRYSPFPSVLPSTWTPVIDPHGGDPSLGWELGAAVGGLDAIERHAWGVEGAIFPGSGRLTAAAGYRYRGLGNPVIDLSTSQRWAVQAARGVLDSSGKPLPAAVLRRDRRLEISSLWLLRRWRRSSWLATGAELHDLDLEWDDPAAAANRPLLRYPLDVGASLEAGYSSARGYAFSVGPQEGVALSASLEGHRYTRALPGESEPGGYMRLTGRGRAYQPMARLGFGRQVLAARLGGGVETGPRSPGFRVGGASGGRAPLPIDLEILGGGLAFPIRGYPSGVQRGNRAVSGSVEYRVPLLLVERGFRLLPLFFDRAWADFFMDAGTAWCATGCERRFSSANRTPRPLYSVGAELNLDFDAGYGAALPLRFGAALPLSQGGRRSPLLYVRVGRSF